MAASLVTCRSNNADKFTKILGSESFARWLVSLALALALVLALALELELALALELELELALALEIELALVLDIALLYHCISQSFDLPPATTSVSHLTCPLPPHHQSVLALALEIELALDIESYRISASVNHLTCPLPPHQSVI